MKHSLIPFLALVVLTGCYSEDNLTKNLKDLKEDTNRVIEEVTKTPGNYVIDTHYKRIYTNNYPKIEHGCAYIDDVTVCGDFIITKAD